MKFSILMICPQCSDFIKDHPSLDVPNALNMRWTGKHWSHTSQSGRILHRYVMRKNEQARTIVEETR